ncbi:MAG: ATP-binding protein [Bryobacteraceae bacterium]
MTRKFSVRLNLTLWYAAILLMGMGAFGGAMWLALSHRLMAGVESRLHDRVIGLRTVLELESGLLESGLNDAKLLQLELGEFAREVPEGDLMLMRDQAGRSFLTPPSGTKILSFDAPVSAPVYATLVRGEQSYRSLTTRIQVGRESYDVLVAGSLAETNAILRDFRQLLFLMVPAILVIACLGGYWISRRALSPVDEITAVAKSISIENLSGRLTVPQTGDELQRMSETWNQVLERLDGAVQRVRQFTADASHELRTPIALIRATAELALRRERTASEYRAALKEIGAESERMTELTESLLALARSDSDSNPFPLDWIDLNGVVGDVMGMLEPVAHLRCITFRNETLPAPTRIRANSQAIRRLLLALVDNALKYTPAGGDISVSTTAVEDGVVLAVKDTGQGIQPENLPYIFERFFRADQARTGGSGAGLGLSIAQTIAKAHGTSIIANSTPGAGSRFELLLKTEPLS